MLSPSLQIAFEIRRSEGGREGGRGRGVFLVVLVVWKVCVAINSTPATCILASLVRFKAFGRGGFIGDSSCSC